MPEVSVAATEGPAAELPPRLVLFDGVCGLCDRSVQWVLSHDPEGRFHFAPLQGPTAATLRERHAEIPKDLDTVIVVERDDAGREHVHMRSRAVFRIIRELPHAPRALRILTVFRVLPAFLTDLAYRFVAAIRYRVWGTLDQCRVPQPEERARFLD